MSSSRPPVCLGTSVGRPLDEVAFHELKELARQYMAGERRNHTLQPTALVNEVWLRLAPGLRNLKVENFKALAATKMRQILIDHARRHNRASGPGRNRHVSLNLMCDDAIAASADIGLQYMLELDQALQDLGKLRDGESCVRVAELKVFTDLPMQAIADVLGVTKTKAEELWRFARAWLRKRLDGNGGEDGSSGETVSTRV